MAGGREVIGGLGLFLEEDGAGGILVSEILHGGPASQSGELLEGDRRVPIPDSVPVAGLSADDAAALIAGPVATQATLIVQVLS
ncbi:hypothetical protein T484DRAFT_1794825 [Baffinella frigidus]|nr:hypothetical protein T484DRAFT_1794825 [Cryptophyta sp. CCMP2293]